MYTDKQNYTCNKQYESIGYIEFKFIHQKYSFLHDLASSKKLISTCLSSYLIFSALNLISANGVLFSTIAVFVSTISIFPTSPLLVSITQT